MINDVYNKYAYSVNWLNLIVILLIILWYLNVQESFMQAF